MGYFDLLKKRQVPGAKALERGREVHKQLEPRPVATRAALWEWIEQAGKGATVGDACELFQITPEQYFSIRDGRD